MTLNTSQDVIDFLQAPFTSAALGAALESGLFWALETKALDATEVSAELGIPEGPCRYWLQLLAESGFLQQHDGRYQPSPAARRAILGTLSRNTWAFLAQEMRERLPEIIDLPSTLRNGSRASRTPYTALMTADPDRARRFTRMLAELHRPLADEIASVVDVPEAARLMDVGGGSGIVSIAFARRHPHLTAVVVDLAPVCAAGREIAREMAVAGRVTYHPADFLSEELPHPFDVVLMCDVGVYDEDLFRRIAGALVPGGRFVIIDMFAPAPGVAPAGRTCWALLNSLGDARFSYRTADDVETLLKTTGFRVRSRGALAGLNGPEAPLVSGMTVVDAVAV